MKAKYLYILIAVLIGQVMMTSCNNPTEEAKAKYIFLFIGDGMGHTNVFITESYLSYKAGKLGGEQLTFTTFPYQGDVTNYTAESNITCSAAAGTQRRTPTRKHDPMRQPEPQPSRQPPRPDRQRIRTTPKPTPRPSRPPQPAEPSSRRSGWTPLRM